MAVDQRSQVLIVGAGPTGLALGLWLCRRGVAVRIIDKAAQPGTTSRALVVHARTLEFYRQLGIADQVVARSLEFAAINLWVRGRQAAHADLGDIGRDLSPFPYVVIFPQDEHEAFLIEKLAAAGVTVERNTELTDFQEQGGQVLAQLRGPDGGTRQWQGDYLAGCDGAHSRTRELLGVEFPGGTYQRVFYVADAAVSGPVANQQLHVSVDEADFMAVFPLAGDRVRLIGTVPLGSEERRQELGWADVSPHAAERMMIAVKQVNWFSTYRVHHRVATSWRRGRVFLLGDAAHVHSPVGGQGMNTGIGDAINLAWKLAAVLDGTAPAALLDSYQPERIAFAKWLVATTDRAFTFVTRDGPLARRVRLGLVPRLLPRLTALPTMRRLIFRVLSQTRINYRPSPLSAGKAGAVRGGDRLPWVKPSGGGPDNFAPLASLDWQLHVYGQPASPLQKEAARRGLPLHSFVWHPDMKAAGLARDAAYLVRPDGHVALADGHARADTLTRYLDRRAGGLSFRPRQ